MKKKYTKEKDKRLRLRLNIYFEGFDVVFVCFFLNVLYSRLCCVVSDVEM